MRVASVHMKGRLLFLIIIRFGKKGFSLVVNSVPIGKEKLFSLQSQCQRELLSQGVPVVDQDQLRSVFAGFYFSRWWRSLILSNWLVFHSAVYALSVGLFKSSRCSKVFGWKEGCSSFCRFQNCCELLSGFQSECFNKLDLHHFWG